jgi:hypothetical protein
VYTKRACENASDLRDQAAHMRMLTWFRTLLAWYKSWFRTSGTLDLDAYAKHVAAAFGLCLGFIVLDLGLFGLALSLLIGSHTPAWAGWLLILINMSLGLLAFGSLSGILVASTLRFVRHLMAVCASQDERRS